MSRSEVTRRLLGPPMAGPRAFYWAILAVAIPTLLRLAVDHMVSGAAMTPYVPFVLLSAIFLNWKYAVAVSLAAAVLADALFIGTRPKLLEGPEDLFALAFFLTASAIIILFVSLVRSILTESSKPEPAPTQKNNVVFSLERGEAWAGWNGHSSRVHLGPEEEVAEMMEDFLAQKELAERLKSPRL